MNRRMHRQQVLFSNKYDWENHIRRKLFIRCCYIPNFKNYSEADLNEFDILIPQHLTDIVFLINHYPELHGHKCFIPPLSSLNICNDKMLFNQFMMASGFGDMIPETGTALPFPYILKKRIDENGTCSRIIKSNQEEQPFQKFIHSDDYYRQEYIVGQDEFTTHVLMVGGRCVFHKTLRFTFEKNCLLKAWTAKQQMEELFYARSLIHSHPF